MADIVMTESKNNLASREAWPAKHSSLSRAFEKFCRGVFKSYCPLSSHGREHLPSPPFLICSNHASHIDSAILMVGADLPFNKTGLIAAKDYFFDQSQRLYLHYLMNLVPIARGSGSRAVKESLDASASFLQSGGRALIIYPEGTRSQTGKIAKFKEGAAILAHKLDIAMVPAHVAGSFKALPKGAYFLRPAQLQVSFGVPLRVSDFIAPEQAHDRKALFQGYRDATAELERRVRALEAASLHA